MKRLLALAAVGATAAAGVTAIPALGATKSVRLVDNKFSPASVTVRRGTTVRFVWAGENPHNVFVTRGPVKFNSGPAKVRDSLRKRMTRRGTYSIVCTLHGGMTLKLRVR